MKKIILVALGFIFLCFGSIGVFLPILPTTPFLLLSAACFAKGSEKFHKWFLGTKLYKRHLDSFIKSRAMPLKTKFFLCSFASVMLILAMLAMDSPHLRIFLLCLMAFKYYYFIFKIKTIPRLVKVDSKKIV